MFLYFDTSASVDIEGDKVRVLSDSPLVEKYTQAGCPQIPFQEWYDAQSQDWKDAVVLDAVTSDTFIDDVGEGPMVFSLIDGEPVEEDEEKDEEKVI